MGAVQALIGEMKADPELAWAWHCNIAVPIMDAANVDHQTANETAAFLMFHLFDYDITTHPHYEHGKTDAQRYAEVRIAAEREEDVQLAAAAKAAGEVRR